MKRYKHCTDEQAEFNIPTAAHVKKDEALPPHVLNGIAKGQEDIRTGRTVTLEGFRKKLSVL